jgi:hypothetical protein
MNLLRPCSKFIDLESFLNFSNLNNFSCVSSWILKLGLLEALVLSLCSEWPSWRFYWSTGNWTMSESLGVPLKVLDSDKNLSARRIWSSDKLWGLLTFAVCICSWVSPFWGYPWGSGKGNGADSSARKSISCDRRSPRNVAKKNLPWIQKISFSTNWSKKSKPFFQTFLMSFLLEP